MSLEAKGLMIWILNMNIHIYPHVRTKFAKSIYKEDFRGGGEIVPPPLSYLTKKYPTLTTVKIFSKIVKNLLIFCLILTNIVQWLFLETYKALNFPLDILCVDVIF